MTFARTALSLTLTAGGSRKYLRQHPNGHFADLARARLVSPDMN
jgi:hypothetical protein